MRDPYLDLAERQWPDTPFFTCPLCALDLELTTMHPDSAWHYYYCDQCGNWWTTQGTHVRQQFRDESE